ncbi:SRPBCC family protein [Arenimonas composti]|uniref:Activator of Hsp90 ATPase homologue 1/2-like C-terminal domain-containing protein n=1 Tax=Arenimonas composti TR7-09 = DSM 18010 TaxID=1121013 RepID=A0A091BFI0_9GAMM|nr:SRPBCC family protein [Arenimonas composti]KFN50471.1 hypothetical protein P873_07350 [Arenimonas composti TR7-09 = DSM 18010]
MQITVETYVAADPGRVWTAWNSPADICAWNAASDDWHTTRAEVDLRPGGRFTARMEAKDGSFGFDFGGEYTRIEPGALIEYRMDDHRRVRVEFLPEAGGVRIRETFDAESTHTPEQQREGWQAILDRFARHVAAGAGAAS